MYNFNEEKINKVKWSDRNQSGFYKSKIKGYECTISFARDYNGFYVVISHLKKDIRFNSLWQGMTFKTFDLAEEFCLNFDYKNNRCFGKDIKN